MVGSLPVFSLKTAWLPRIVWRPYRIFDLFEGGANFIAQLGEPGARARFSVFDGQDTASLFIGAGQEPGLAQRLTSHHGRRNRDIERAYTVDHGNEKPGGGGIMDLRRYPGTFPSQQ